VTALPELPAATVVWFDNLPGVTALPELPAATVVRFYNLPNLPAERPKHVAARGTIYRNGQVWL
jgi:hypothetical protein